VFDTYARCTPTSDENSTLDTKINADAMLNIRKAFDGHVTTIHHMNAQGRIRGNTALRDAIDTVWEVSKEGSRIKLHCNKMRGYPEPEDFFAEMRSILLDQDNPDDIAPVIFSTDAPNTETFTPRVQLQMLDILQASGQLSSNTWARQCEEAYQIVYATFNNHRKILVDCGLVEMLGEKVKGKRVTYTISEKGRELLG
jgi:hypothetical protein